MLSDANTNTPGHHCTARLAVKSVADFRRHVLHLWLHILLHLLTDSSQPSPHHGQRQPTLPELSKIRKRHLDLVQALQIHADRHAYLISFPLTSKPFGVTTSNAAAPSLRA
jgi:hypothetical protein